MGRPLNMIVMNADGSMERYNGTIEDGKYKGPRRHTGIAEKIWCMVYAMAWVYGREILKGLDWLGQKLVDLIDHSDFFAGAVWTYTLTTAWELLAKK